MNAKEFVVDYIERHAHPANAVLHVVGVPAAFTGLYFFCICKFLLGFALLVCGYFFQYLGHKVQGNEVGEVTLIKNIIRNLKKRANSSV